MGEVVTLPVVRVERNRGNGAREAVAETLDATLAFAANHCTPERGVTPLDIVDYFVGRLWITGFMVVPIEHVAPPCDVEPA